MQTTSRAVYALLLVWLHKPKIQEMAQQEIDQVIGERLPRLSDRIRCPFIESMTLEILRYISHVPTSIPHAAVVDTTLQGYHIPKGTEVGSLYLLCQMMTKIKY